MIEQSLERVDYLTADPGMAAAKTEQFQDDHQPDDMARKRRAEPGAVRQDQVALQLGETVVGDPGLGEQAEPGVDAIDGGPAGDDPVDRRGGDCNAGERGIVQAGGGAGPQLAQGAKIDGRGIEGQCHWRAS